MDFHGLYCIQTLFLTACTLNDSKLHCWAKKSTGRVESIQSYVQSLQRSGTDRRSSNQFYIILIYSTMVRSGTLDSGKWPQKYRRCKSRQHLTLSACGLANDRVHKLHLPTVAITARLHQKRLSICIAHRRERRRPAVKPAVQRCHL